jgi:hypothetical protein
MREPKNLRLGANGEPDANAPESCTAHGMRKQDLSTTIVSTAPLEKHGTDQRRRRSYAVSISEQLKQEGLTPVYRPSALRGDVSLIWSWTADLETHEQS